MFVTKVFVGVLLVLSVFAGYGENAAQAPTGGSPSLYDFIPFIIQNMVHMIEKTVHEDVKAVKDFSSDFGTLVKQFFNDTNTIRQAINKTMTDFQKMRSFSNSSDPIVQLIDFGIAADTLVVDVLKLLDSGEQFLYHLYSSFKALGLLVQTTFTDNVQDISDIITLIPNETYKEGMSILSLIQKLFTFVVQAIESVFEPKTSRSKAKRDLSSENRVSSAIHGSEMALMQSNMYITFLEIRISSSMQNLNNVTTPEVINIITNIAEDIKETAEKINDLKLSMQQEFFSY